MTITILGLGPGDPELLTRRAWRTLDQASEVYLRTARHPGIEALPNSAAYHSFDALYEQAENFEALYDRIAAEVMRLAARPEGVLYAVPGHPLVGEATVVRILKLAEGQMIPVTVIDGLSFIEPTLAALHLDGLDGIQIVDAEDVARLHHPQLNPDVPALLGQLYSPAIASDVKLTLANQYPDECRYSQPDRGKCAAVPNRSQPARRAFNFAVHPGAALCWQFRAFPGDDCPFARPGRLSLGSETNPQNAPRLFA